MPNPTGCILLDKAGVTAGRMWQRPDLCLNCPYPECMVKTQDDALIKRRKLQKSREVCLRCKKCGALETLIITNGKLEKTQRWLQREDTIYHLVNCGIAEEIRA